MGNYVVMILTVHNDMDSYIVNIHCLPLFINFCHPSTTVLITYTATACFTKVNSTERDYTVKVCSVFYYFAHRVELVSYDTVVFIRFIKVIAGTN